jgi:hypothetical protein
MGVTFINTKGMAFIGPGSEWFWAALQFTALLITFIAIYRQLRIARSASAFRQVEDYQAKFDSEGMRRQRLSVLVAVRDGNTIPESAGVAVGNYFETLATLGRNGHLDTKVLWSAISSSTKIWWTILEPFVRSSQADWGVGIYADFEWLVGTIDGMDRRAGSVVAFDATWVAKRLPHLIEVQQDALRVEQSLRSVIIAPPDGLDSGQSAAAVAAPAPSPSLKAENEQENQAD